MKRRSGSWRIATALCVCLGFVLSGCVYYNKFYTAKKAFNQAEDLYERPDANPTPQQVQLYDKALRGATRVLVEHPTSSWVDDAVVMMGRSLIGKSDFPRAREKFEEFYQNFPDSPLMDQALYYHGEAYRKERMWEFAVARYDSVRLRFPRSNLVGAAELQTGKVFSAQGRYPRALAMLRPVAQQGGDLELDARLALAEVYYRSARYDSAAVEYEWVSKKTDSPELLNEATLRYGECLELRSRHEEAIRVYETWEERTANPTYKDHARIRIGTAYANAGDTERGINVLESVVAARRRTPAAAEALFQIAYVQETLLDDFELARATYAKVLDEGRNTSFAQQAKHRLDNLDRIEQLRATAESDSAGVSGAAAAAFNLAEHYLFELQNPSRALDEYATVESTYPESPYAAKSAFAGAWILERKLEQPERADSAWRYVASHYPETEHGRAAAAFLGDQVDSLRSVEPLASTQISSPYTPGATPYVKPAPKLNLQDRGNPNARTAAGTLAIDSLATADSLRAVLEGGRGRELALADTLAVGDSLRTYPPADSARGASPDTSGSAVPDTSRTAPADTSRPAAPDTSRKAVPDTSSKSASGTGVAP